MDTHYTSHSMASVPGEVWTKLVPRVSKGSKRLERQPNTKLASGTEISAFKDRHESTRRFKNAKQPQQTPRPVCQFSYPKEAVGIAQGYDEGGQKIQKHTRRELGQRHPFCSRIMTLENQ